MKNNKNQAILATNWISWIISGLGVFGGLVGIGVVGLFVYQWWTGVKG